MNVSAPWGGPPGLPSHESPGKLREAGRQFESLLLTQLLQSARSSDDSTSDCATDYAEQQFAEALSHAGGLGIAHMIENGLRTQTTEPR